jgi:hypothetical protein
VSGERSEYEGPSGVEAPVPANAWNAYCAVDPSDSDSQSQQLARRDVAAEDSAAYVDRPPPVNATRSTANSSIALNRRGREFSFSIISPV